jgi:hypothetical protein
MAEKRRADEEARLRRAAQERVAQLELAEGGKREVVGQGEPVGEAQQRVEEALRKALADLGKADDDCKRWEREVALWQKRLADKEKESAEAVESVRKSQAGTVQGMRDRMGQLENECARAKAELNSIKAQSSVSDQRTRVDNTSSPDPDPSAKLSEELKLQRALDQNTMLKGQVAFLKAKLDESDRLGEEKSEQLRSAMTETKELVTEGVREQLRVVPGLKARVASLERENETLKGKVTLLESEVQEKRDVVRGLEDRLGAVDGEGVREALERMGVLVSERQGLLVEVERLRRRAGELEGRGGLLEGQGVVGRSGAGEGSGGHPGPKTVDRGVVQCQD